MSMTAAKITSVAAFHGLEVLKRITTGNSKRHFATFELTGPAERVAMAWAELEPHVRHKDFDKLVRVSNPDHPDHGQPMIVCESVWVDC